jgi:4-hydroxy-tetrahydrodipicolinate synthase
MRAAEPSPAVDLDLRGLWVPVLTPLTPDGDVDGAALDRLARRLLADGCAGLVALGTTSEPATLRGDERERVVELCAAACADAGRPLIVGVGSNCTRSTIEDALRVEALVHPAALLVVVPYYTRPSEAGVVEHFRAVTSAVATPLVAYNVPYRTGRGLGASAILSLAELPQVVGMKQAVGALDHDTLEVLRRRPPGFQVLAGDDAYITPTVLMGGAGAIAAAAHVCTPAFVTMVDAALAGDVPTATALAHALLPVVDAGFAEPNPAAWKAALHATAEIAAPALRAPMTPASPTTTTALLTAIATASRTVFDPKQPCRGSKTVRWKRASVRLADGDAWSGGDG